MNKIVNQTPYLRTSRTFPEDIKQLTVEINKSYIDTANAVNARTIGIFTVNRPAITGEIFFVDKNQKQQVLRQVYLFSDSNLIFNHNINFSNANFFKIVYGEFFDGTYWQNIPYIDVLSATNQINVKIDATNIIITKGAGAPPAIVKGILVVEWIVDIKGI